FRLMQLLPGVGPTSAQRVLDAMADKPDPLAALSGIPAPPRSGDDWTAFVAALQTIQEGRAAWPTEIELARRWYEPHLDRIHEDASVRQADLLQLEQIAAGYSSRERFLTELTLDPPDATSDQSGVPLLDEEYFDFVRDPFGEGAGAEGNRFAKSRRRLSSLRTWLGNHV